MSVTLYRTATEYIAVPITLSRGKVSDISSVGMFLDSTLAVIPAVNQFTTVTLVDGTQVPVPPLGVAGEIDVLALVGPGAGSNFPSLTQNTAYQIWVLITTNTETIIRKGDTLNIT